ncbi:MAG: Rieske 2Fe-2S domain-containing protein [Anaeromyxobacter sp.]|nr:Rieske 2Fe-2S domain-containing protein [Anaeromyxobacter sp.]MBL0275281.1 Rieske 2Fe-2S domain-containing protein [Anaeromyxobacter sp.]
MTPTGKGLGRRGFLAVLGGGGAAAVAGAALPGCAPTNGPAPSVSVPPPDQDGNVIFRLADFPDLDRPGGAVIARAAGMDPLLVVRTPVGDVAAVSATCTHQGCPLGFEDPEVVCPCHQSRFDLGGAVLKAPATAPLATFLASYDSATGLVTIALASFPPVVAGAVTLLFSRFPELQAPGGSAVGRPAGFDSPILVMALAGGAFAAVNARCPHQGCTVAFPASGGGQVVCPCHLSRFQVDGALVTGPATVGLAAYPAVADALGVVVTLPG